MGPGPTPAFASSNPFSQKGKEDFKNSCFAYQKYINYLNDCQKVKGRGLEIIFPSSSLK
jgi:hypothetical protein